MANNGVIKIKFVDGNKKVPGPEPINDKMDKEADSDKLDTAILGALIYREAKRLSGMVLNEAKYQMNLHYQMTDDYLGQQNMNIALGVIEKVKSTALSIYTGAKVGFTAGGAGGAIVGAVFAAGYSVANTAVDMFHNYQQETIKLNQLDAQLQFNRRRAGYSLTAGSVGEGL